uniref:Transcription factor MYC/MYB N-terminal domain-containing protein n=2 Tax=Aegilops tauschii subsp. strangulata TaxID=200361 RepID=A0A452XZD2_AEGTS
SGRSADAMASSGEVQRSLQAVAQGLRWTYAILWQLCPDQGYNC